MHWWFRIIETTDRIWLDGCFQPLVNRLDHVTSIMRLVRGMLYAACAVVIIGTPLTTWENGLLLAVSSTSAVVVVYGAYTTWNIADKLLGDELPSRNPLRYLYLPQRFLNLLICLGLALLMTFGWNPYLCVLQTSSVLLFAAANLMSCERPPPKKKTQTVPKFA